jgi:hypothetical protein
MSFKKDKLKDDPTQIIFDEINVHKKQLEEEKISEGFLEQADERITYSAKIYKTKLRI